MAWHLLWEQEQRRFDSGHPDDGDCEIRSASAIPTLSEQVTGNPPRLTGVRQSRKQYECGRVP